MGQSNESVESGDRRVEWWVSQVIGNRLIDKSNYRRVECWVARVMCESSAV
ncbi:hypothetical protein J6590_095276 [Homalodisca vitripennis]|nr:hypothetical protein J6590_095276 [Homalodisca vitripennis]